MFALRSIASKLGLTFKVLADDGGWISTTYLVRVEGSKEAIDDYRRVLRRMAKDLE
jgi:peroxiredoxin